MNDLRPEQRDSFVSLLLEEHFDSGLLEEHFDSLPPEEELDRLPPEALVDSEPERAEGFVQPGLRDDRNHPTGPTPRPSRLLAAAALLLGTGVVLGIALQPDPGSNVVEGQNPQGKSLAARAFFPLRLGDRWTYRERIGDWTDTVEVECTAINVVQGRQIAQLTTVRKSGIEFSYWSTDDLGVHRHANQARVFDPVFHAIADGSSCELPSPVGAHATWQLRRVPPREVGQVGGARTGPAKPRPLEEARRLRAELRGVHRELVIGGQKWRTVEVLYAGIDDKGTATRHYARGVGLVRETVTAPGQPTRELDLVRFVPAAPRPDRTNLLATAVPIASARAARWLEKPVDEDAAWTMRSEFAAVEVDGKPRIFRVFGDRAQPFDVEQLADFERLATEEGWPKRMHGLMPQRATMAMAWLRCQLPALAEQRRLTTMSSTIFVDRQSVFGKLTLADVATGTPVSANVALTDGVPTRISVK